MLNVRQIGVPRGRKTIAGNSAFLFAEQVHILWNATSVIHSGDIKCHWQGTRLIVCSRIGDWGENLGCEGGIRLMPKIVWRTNHSQKMCENIMIFIFVPVLLVLVYLSIYFVMKISILCLMIIVRLYFCLQCLPIIQIPITFTSETLYTHLKHVSFH